MARVRNRQPYSAPEIEAIAALAKTRKGTVGTYANYRERYPALAGRSLSSVWNAVCGYRKVSKAAHGRVVSKAATPIKGRYLGQPGPNGAAPPSALNYCPECGTNLRQYQGKE